MSSLTIWTEVIEALARIDSGVLPSELESETLDFKVGLGDPKKTLNPDYSGFPQTDAWNASST